MVVWVAVVVVVVGGGGVVGMRERVTERRARQRPSICAGLLPSPNPRPLLAPLLTAPLPTATGASKVREKSTRSFGAARACEGASGCGARGTSTRTCTNQDEQDSRRRLFGVGTQEALGVGAF